MIDLPAHHQHNTLSDIHTNIPLDNKNWFRTGGLAQYYSEPTTPAEFCDNLLYANKHNLPLFILGEGANILISDDGFYGLVIRPRLNNITLHEYDNEYCLVEAGAGVAFSTLISYCLDNHLMGLEEFSGIPGTVGGSVFINIHYFEFLLSQFLAHAQIINRHSGVISTVSNAWFTFSYDYSQLHTQEHYVISATFKLKKGSLHDAIHAQGRSNEIIRHRRNRYPHTGTCGSFFRNFHEHEIASIIDAKRLPFIAYYLDKLGVKGELCVGDAIVSHQHANMIVNKGKALSDDIITLARTMQELVYKKFGIIPQPECQLIGFKHYPLL